MLWSKGLYREHLSRVIGHLKRALRMEQRLTVEEFHQLLQLSEAIIEHGRMIQAYLESSVPNVIVGIPELARRFRRRRRPSRTRSCYSGTWVVQSLFIWADVGNCNWQALFPAVARAFTRRRATPIVLTMIRGIWGLLKYLA
jgi:hypothetical protein